MTVTPTAPGQALPAAAVPVPAARTTVRPVPPAGDRPEQLQARRRTRSTGPREVGTTIGCAVSSLFTAWLLYYRLTPASGWLGFLLTWYALFLVALYVVTVEAEGRVVAKDRLAQAAVASGAVLLFLPLAFVLAFVLVKGLPALRLGFFLHDQKSVVATDPATAGGGLHAIVGTLEQVGIALVLSAPLGLLTAVLLSETRHRMRRPVRLFVEAMSGLPSEVAGLFIYASLILFLQRRTGHPAFSGVMASLALAMVMIPTIARTVEVVLRLVPDGLREASLALGSSQARTVWSVVLPTARSGLATAVVLGIARSVGETAPLIFTTLGSNIMNADPFHGQQDALPLFVYMRIQLQSAAAQQRAYTGALVLLMLVLLLFTLVRMLGRSRRSRT